MKKGVLYPCFKHWEEKNTIWLYSDPHFGDEQARAFRKELLGWDITDQEKVQRINSKVGKNDIIIFLGDIGDTTYINNVRGYKVLVMGNHDKGKTNYESIFDEVYDGSLTLNKKVILSHVPFLTEYFFNIHGHVHRGPDPAELGINMCCEFHDYYPVNLNDILLSGRLKEVKDLNRQQIERRLTEKFPEGWRMQKCVVCGKVFKTYDLFQDICESCSDAFVDFIAEE